MIGNTILLALREIRRNVLRSFLTILGIVIGVGAVITMVTIGGGATLQVRQQIASLGSNMLIVSAGKRMGPGQASSAALFKEADAEAIETEISDIASRSPGHHPVAQGHLRKPELVHLRGRDRQPVPAGHQPGHQDGTVLQRRRAARQARRSASWGRR